jgi:hypothetical protein
LFNGHRHRNPIYLTKGNHVERIALLAASALTLAAVATAAAQAPTVSLTVGKPAGGPEGTTTTVVYGELVRVSGELSNGQPNQTVQLTITPYRATPRTVTLRTDAGGDFEYTHRPAIRTSYSASWNNQASAQEPYAHVLPKVGVRVISARLGQFRVTMAAQPQHVSRVVWFQRRITATRWATVKKIQVRGPNLSATFTARLPRGTSRVRILVPQTPGYIRATSRFVRVTR